MAFPALACSIFGDGICIDGYFSNRLNADGECEVRFDTDEEFPFRCVFDDDEFFDDDLQLVTSPGSALPPFDWSSFQ